MFFFLHFQLYLLLLLFYYSCAGRVDPTAGAVHLSRGRCEQHDARAHVPAHHPDGVHVPERQARADVHGLQEHVHHLTGAIYFRDWHIRERSLHCERLLRFLIWRIT